MKVNLTQKEITVFRLLDFTMFAYKSLLIFFIQITNKKISPANKIIPITPSPSSDKRNYPPGLPPRSLGKNKNK